MAENWSAGTFLAKARELSRRLKRWHIDSPTNPFHTATAMESEEWVRLTFRAIVTAPQEIREEEEGEASPMSTTLTTSPDGRPEEFQLIFYDPKVDGCEGIFLHNPEQDNDRSLTQWLLRDFHRHLAAASTCPALDYLKGMFDQILKLPAWAVRAPTNLAEKAMAKGGYIVTGQKVPAEHLSNLTDAAEKLLASIPTSQRTVGDSAAKDPHPSIPPSPKKILFGWAEILTHLTRPNIQLEHDRIRRLNDINKGPIIIDGQGSQPKVDAAELTTWWNNQVSRLEEIDHRKEDQHATLSSQYQHGRDETVIPEIMGHVKKRKKRPEK